MSVLEIAREEAAKAGITIDDSTLDYLIWNETGFPSFWIGDPETCLREQLQAALIRIKTSQEEDM